MIFYLIVYNYKVNITQFRNTMKQIKTKNNIDLQYMNISEIVDTTAFSEFSYFFVKYHEKGKEVSYFVDENQFFKRVEGEPIIRDWQDSVWLIKNEYFDIVPQYGFYQMEQLYSLNREETPPKRADMFSNNIEQDLTNPEYSLIKMIKNPHSKIAFMNLDGEIFSEPFLIDGSAICELHDAKYHLDELAESLSHRDDIAFITYTGRFDQEKSTMLGCPLTGNEPSIGGVISEIEHYLEEGESQPAEKEEITLFYFPNKNNVEYLLNFDSRTHGRLPENQKAGNYFVERYILNEILGAKEFLINPPEVEVKVRKFKH